MMHRAALLRHCDAMQPFGETLRHVLLKESLLSDAALKALHRDGAAANVRQHYRRDHLVICRELALGDPVVQEQHLFGMRDQRASRTTSGADLSLQRPRNRGCRSLPNFVHSMNPACTTIEGRTQCERRRGSPTALVNGDTGISRASRCARNSSSSLVSNPVPSFPA